MAISQQDFQFLLDTLPKTGGETIPEPVDIPDFSTFEPEDSPVTQEELDFLTDGQILVDFDNAPSATEMAIDQESGFGISDISPLVRVAGERLERVQAGLERQRIGEQFPASTVLQAAGEGVGFLGDVIFEGIKTITPEFIKEGFEDAARKLLDTSLGQAGFSALQQGLERFEEFEQENPEAGANIRATFNLATLLPVMKGAQVGVKGTRQVIGAAGEIIEESGEAALKTQRAGFVRDLLRPKQTKAVKEAEVARTAEVGKGPLRRSVVKPSLEETRAIQQVTDIAEVTPKKSIQRNFNSIVEATGKEAKSLESQLEKADFIFPRKEFSSRLNEARKVLGENPLITGDAEKVAEKLVNKFEQFVKENKAKGTGLLRARKDFDKWVKSQKGTNIFDPKNENALSIALRDIRRTANDFLDEKATDVGVKKSLAKQRSLFKAQEILIPKAADEANTAVGRMLQKAVELLKPKNQTVQSVAAAVGIGGLGAASTFAPTVAVLFGLGFAGGGLTKLVLNPKLRILLGKLLKEVGTKDAALTKQINNLLK